MIFKPYLGRLGYTLARVLALLLDVLALGFRLGLGFVLGRTCFHFPAFG